MTDDVNQKNMNAGGELQDAKREFAEGNVEQGLIHISRAIAEQTDNAEFLTFLDEIIAKTPEIETLSIFREQTEFALAAVKAYILAKSDKFDDALSLLFQVVMTRPEIKYLQWVIKWADVPDFHKIVAPHKLCTYITDTVLNLPDLGEQNRIIRELWEEIFSIIENFRTFYPDDDYLAFLHSISARRACKYDDAIEIAEVEFEKKQNYMTALAVANAYRDVGKIKKALEFYGKCLEFEPENIELKNDMAEMLCSSERIDEGIRLFEEVLEVEPENALAKPSFYYYQYLSTKDVDWRNKLERFSMAHPDFEHAAKLVDSVTPYVGFLPEIREATIDIMRQLAKKFRDAADDDFKGKINIDLPYPEYPSSRLSAEMMLALHDWDIPLIFSVQNVPTPDPRDVRGKPEYRIWVYKDGQPMPVVDAPTSEISRIIANIAVTSFNIHNWCEIAKAEAVELDSDELPSLLGIMAHPPMPHPDYEVWDWIFRVQLAASLIIAYIDDGWDNSLRKNVLFSLLHCAADWTVSTAIIALTELALDTSEIRAEIVDEFVELLDNKPNAGYWCVEYPLVTNLLRIPGLDDKTREFFEKYRSDLENY